MSIRISVLGCLFAFFAFLFAAGAGSAAESLINAPDASGRAAPRIEAPLQGTPGGGGVRNYPEVSGWPATMGVNPQYAPGGGPATVDVNGDGVMEVFAASTDQRLYGWRTDGTALPGFPITLVGRAQSSPAVGNIDADPAPEILVNTTSGYIYAFNTDGSAVPGWPKVPGGTLGGFISVVLQDFDNDGVLEVVQPAGNQLYVWRGNGTNYPGFPVTFASSYGAAATPAVGDLDGDGQLEIVLEGWEWLHVFHQDGTVAAGWPYHLPLSYEGFSYSAPALADFDHDGKLEIVAGYHESGGGNWSGKVAIWRYDGTVAPGWPRVMSDFGSWDYSTPALGDVDEDGGLEFAMISHNGFLYLFNFDGSAPPGFPVYTGYVNLEASCAIADIDDDGHLEICVGTNDPTYLAYERDGTLTPGFPTPMAGGMMVSGSCIADVDGDGNVNICAHDRAGQVHLWNLPFPVHADRMPWPRPHHDDHHTGFFGPQGPSGVRGTVARAGELRLLPNPTQGRFTAELRGAGGPVRWSLCDLTGRLVSGNPAGAGIVAPGMGAVWSFDLACAGGDPLPAGRYFVVAEREGRTWVRSVVLVR
jgi:hypothetical protein